MTIDKLSQVEILLSKRMKELYSHRGDSLDYLSLSDRYLEFDMGCRDRKKKLLVNYQ